MTYVTSAQAFDLTDHLIRVGVEGRPLRGRVWPVYLRPGRAPEQTQACHPRSPPHTIERAAGQASQPHTRSSAGSLGYRVIDVGASLFRTYTQKYRN